MNEKEVEELCNLISAAEYFNERIATLQHLSSFHKIPDFLEKIKDFGLTVIELTVILNSLSETID